MAQIDQNEVQSKSLKRKVLTGAFRYLSHNLPKYLINLMKIKSIPVFGLIQTKLKYLINSVPINYRMTDKSKKNIF